jgi:hypothetical protein
VTSPQTDINHRLFDADDLESIRIFRLAHDMLEAALLELRWSRQYPGSRTGWCLSWPGGG